MKSQAEEVLNIVKAHNAAWSKLEDLSEQEKYIHDDIVFIAPPYKSPVEGKIQYLKNYKSFIEHATVHYFKEVKPKVQFYNNGQTAVVTFGIDMSFDFDDISNPSWRGMDIMTLVHKNDKWLIVSDMYAKQIESE
ncbi:DUF4440 domain-containing protein [Candidatus Neomarinimicrobiota bacterium]